MTYKDFIQNIINERGQWGIPDTEYYENHHIVPRCLGGSGDIPRGDFYRNSKNPNCIRLYPWEHFIAHKLLMEENPDNRQLAYAYLSMCEFKINGRENIVTPEDYEKARLLSIQLISEDSKKRWQTEEFKLKQKAAWTPERKLKISESNKNRKIKDETRKKLSQKRKGKPSPKKGKKLSEETKQKISKAVKGENNPMYGKTHTEEAKQKLREANLGKEMYWWNNGEKNTMANDCPGPDWKRGRLGGFHDKKKRHTKGHIPKQYLWETETGELVIMDKSNAGKWHPNWKLIKEVKVKSDD